MKTLGQSRLQRRRVVGAVANLDLSFATTDERKCHSFGRYDIASGPEGPIRYRARDYYRDRSSRRSSWALMATITVLADIRTAPIAGARTMPAQ